LPTGVLSGLSPKAGTGSCATAQLHKDEFTRKPVAKIGTQMAAFELLTAAKAIFFQVWRLDRFMFLQSWKNFKVQTVRLGGIRHGASFYTIPSSIRAHPRNSVGIFGIFRFIQLMEIPVVFIIEIPRVLNEISIFTHVERKCI
jgi:hypothetical protein